MNSLKNFGKKLLRMKALKILIIILLILLIFLPSFVYNITLDDAEYKEGDESNVPYIVSTIVAGSKCDEQGIKTGIEPEKLWNQMIDNGTNVNEYLDKVEELEKLLNAEIITQYPKFGFEGEGLDGIIEFERHNTDGESLKLKYLDSETFNNYVDLNDETVLDYFTLDENNNAVVAVINKKIETLESDDSNIKITDYTTSLNEENENREGRYTKTTVSISKKSINYKSLVSKYTMPFQYLWSLLVISEDKEFVLDLADLVANSEIIVSIYDNITTTVNTNTYTFQNENRTDTYVKYIPATGDTPIEKYWMTDGSAVVKNVAGEADYNVDSKVYTTTYETTNINNNLNIELTKANVWIVDYTKEYSYKSNEQTSNNENRVDLENTEFIQNEGSPVDSNKDSNLLNNSHAVAIKNQYSNKDTTSSRNNIFEQQNTLLTQQYNTDTSNLYVRCSYYTREVNRKQTTTSRVSSQKYVSGTTNVIPKVEKKEGETNFVTLLCSHKKARKIILEIPTWLFEVLEQNDATKNMVDLTKYLLNKLVGSNRFGDIEIDFNSLFSPANLSNITVGSGDFAVNDANLFIKDVETLKLAFTGYSASEKLIENAQGFLDMQNTYNVNAIFAAAVSITETGAGRAGHAVDGLNNWFNFRGNGPGGWQQYGSVASAIDAFGYNIANGSYYYTQGRTTVATIGPIYCPNDATHPTQGDDWVSTTLTYIQNFYAAAGISISNNMVDGTAEEKLNYLFPEGVPTTESECSNYITSAEVALTTKDGEKTTGTIRIHRSLVSDVQQIFQIAQDAGFKIYEAAGYSYRTMNNGGSGNLSHHSYGVAIDINVNENYSHNGSTVYAGSFWDPGASEFSIPVDGALYKAFMSKGWKWGGDWSGTYQDYMHFSYTGN